MTILTEAPTLVDLDKLQKRSLSLQMRLSSLNGQAVELNARRARLSKSIALAKARVELAPQAQDVFNYLQEKAHSRAVGEFEDLLSAFVSDVVPEAGSIHLELGTERGAPSLDILLNNGGDMENILEGNGGGLTNIVVTGLGFSALSRTSNRAMMLLDEPDCWMKAKHIPNFTKVIAELSNPLPDSDRSSSPGCQTLMISHNDISLMDEGAHIQDLRLERDLENFAKRCNASIKYVGEKTNCAYVTWMSAEGKQQSKSNNMIVVEYRPENSANEDSNALTKGFPYVESISGARSWENSEIEGIRWVEVENLRRHIKTRLDLSSGLNVLTGDINGGKSSLYFTALRAIAYGEFDDSMIRHGADYASVRIGLENDVVLEVTRFRKKSPKTLFRRYEKGDLINEGRPETKNAVPEFISSVLRIERVDGMDIQLRSQKQPVFLLNEPASRRAQLLSVGKEAGLLQNLIEKHRLALRRDKEKIRREEIELNEVNQTLKALSPLASLAGLAEIINALAQEALDLRNSLNKLGACVATLAPLANKERIAGLCLAGLDKSLAPPVLNEVRGLSTVLADLKKNELAAKVKDLPALPSVEVKSTSLLADIVTKMTRNKPLDHLLVNLPSLPAPAPLLMDTPSLLEIIKQLDMGQNLAIVADLLPAEPDVCAVASITNESTLRETNNALKTHEKRIAELDTAAKRALSEEKSAIDELNTLKKNLGTCPLCDQAFTTNGDHHHV